MNINYNILDKIREYYSDELSEADAANVERLIRSDEQYVLHHKLFRTAGKGIKEAVDGPKKEWMRALDLAGLSEEEKNTLGQLKKNDRFGMWRRVASLAALVLILATLLGYTGWRQWGEGPGIKAPTINSETPIADNSEIPIAEKASPVEEERLGSTGAKVMKAAAVYVFSSEVTGFEATGEERPVSIQRWPAPGISYVFTGDTLLVFTETPKAFEEAPLRWLEKENAAYLDLDGKVYELERSVTRRQPLKEAVGWKD